VSLHIAVSAHDIAYKQISAKTKNLFDKAQFDAMREGSVLVNTARLSYRAERLTT